ncbi:vWA domain-containing protein [Planococcus salinus]|uniref:VWA domain-containing protein n=1 Tax=Planococcus salinus TaxID=1848460 RepID=A0A3M8PAK1_9BACL|nr:BatA and WFA domain-containing protein [Planococcus salinus]RNF40745.1 VWA domain-containing protein [Planococcus salinus]
MGISGWGLIWTAIMPLAVILYYFFRKKYKDQTVSSTLLWRELMKEMQASPFLKKLQHQLLFYLQLAALILCVVALLGPFIHSEELEGNEFIFIVDTSATMLAGTPTRFEQQQATMTELAAQTGGKPVTIITTGASPEVVLRHEREPAKVTEAIDRLAVTYEKAEIEQALLFAETLVDNDSTVIHVFTDALDRSVFTHKAGFAYEVHGFDNSLQNLSIRQFGLSETDNGMRAFVQIVNNSAEAMEGIVEIQGGNTTESAQVSLEPDEEVLVPFDSLPQETVWQATLDAADEYRADNDMVSYAQNPVQEVFVDSRLHELLATGFESLNLDVNLVAPDQLQNLSGAPVVTNQTAFLESEEPVLLIGRDDESTHQAAGQVEAANHPLFTYADLEDVYVSELYPPFEGFETIATINGEPFIQLSPTGDIIVLTDVQLTDWPLHPSFPLFLWSASQELSATENFLGFFQPNEHRSVPLMSSSGEWEIFKDGSYLYSYMEGQGPFIAPEQPGRYEVRGDSGKRELVVQLSSEEKELASGSTYSIGTAESTEETVQFSLVPWLIAAVLLLLFVEWEVYRRGTSNR